MPSSKDIAPFDCLFGLCNLLSFPSSSTFFGQCPKRLKEDAGALPTWALPGGRGQELASGCLVTRSS